MNAIELVAEYRETMDAEVLHSWAKDAARLLREQHEALRAADDLVRECRNPVPDPVFRKHLADRAFTALEPFRRAYEGSIASKEGE